jgi:hypothetical protein
VTRGRPLGSLGPRAIWGVLAILGTGLAAGCGTATIRTASASPPPTVTAPLSTSLVTAQGSWAITVMGGSAASQDNFWQLFVRPAGASRWSLVTPPGVADNGGLVAAGGRSSLVIGFRPSQSLAFSPLATSTDTGQDWTPGLLDAPLADTAGAIAVAPSGRILALRQDGSIAAAATAGAAAAGRWSPLTTRNALAASGPGRDCGLQGLSALSFGPNGTPMAAGSCARRGVAGVFTDTGGTWQSAGLAVPAGFGSDQVQVLGLAGTAGGNVAILRAGNSLLAAWSAGTRWTVSAPLSGIGSGAVRASGFGAGGSAWLLLSDGRAETITGAGGSWRALPPVPAGTTTLVPAGTGTPGPTGTGTPAAARTGTAAAGGGGAYDALAVARSKLTVWQLAATAWAKVQLINVPIEYGSSS